VFAALALAAGARVFGADRPTLPAIVERFDHLTIGKPLVVASPLTLSSEHMECKLQSGNAAPVLAGDEVVGIFFEGTGTMDYLSADPLEASTVLFNAKKGSSLKPERTDKGVRLRDTFRHVLWLAQGRSLPALTGAAFNGGIEASFQAQREKFGRVIGAPPSHDFAIQKLDAPAAAFVHAELDGGAEDVVYEMQGMDNPDEYLSVLASSESDDPEARKYLYEHLLSRQPVGRDSRVPPPPRVILADVDVDLKASDGDDATLSVLETLIPVGKPIAALRLHLRSRFYTSFGNNLTTRDERLRKVTDESGRSLPFVHNDQEVLVQLAEPVPPDRPVKLKFDIDGNFLVRPGGDSYWELGTTSWFPQPSLSGQFYTFHANVRVKKPFVPFAPGKTVRRIVEGDDNVLETRVEKPVCFAVILAGRYELDEEVKNGVTIRVATYALKNPRAVKQLTALADSIITYYQEFLGPFPMPEFNIIEINDYGFGQAPPGTMFITKEAFNPYIGEENQLYSQGINERFAHEIAHQYWGISVKMPSYEEQWLTESFAEYCAGIFLKTYKNEATYNMLVKHWRAQSTFATDQVPIPLANQAWISGDSRTRFFVRTGLLYNKGPYLLYSLHKELGDEAFFTFLKSYQKSFAWKLGASTKLAAGLLQYMTKKDYMPFFDKYYWGIEMPRN
jgi:hypothetical protein